MKRPDLTEINDAIFRQADRVFKELELKPYNGGWRGSMGFFGTAPTRARPDKTVITRSQPYRILEQGGGSKSYWDYIAERDGLRSPSDTYKRLWEVSGIEFRIDSIKRPRHPENAAATARKVPTAPEPKEIEIPEADRAELLEEAQSFFVEQLQAGAETTAAYRYLTEQRGYLPEEIGLMGLGFHPSRRELRAHLQAKGFSDDEIDQQLPITDAPLITIPLLSEGILHSFSLRRIGDEGDQAKYLNISGFGKTAALWALPPPSATKGQEIILVESELAALNCSIVTGRIFTAVKGSSISNDQIAQLRRHEPASIVLCFDSDEAGKKAAEAAAPKLLAAGFQVKKATCKAKAPDDEMRENSATSLNEILQAAETLEPPPQPGALERCRSYADLEALIKKRRDPLKTGFETLDQKIRIPMGATTIIAGRPGHGKTTFMLNLMVSLSRLDPTKEILFFSYEESREAIGLRMLTALAQINRSDYRHRYPDAVYSKHIIEAYIKAGHTNIPEIESAKAQLNELYATRVQIFDKPLHLEDLTSQIRTAHESGRIGAVIIDYLTRVKLDEQERKTKVDRICDELKDLAVATGLPIIIGAQINREGVKDAERMPTLTSLKESGNIEEDANTVLLVYRESLQNEEGSSSDNDVGLVTIKALKSRDGEANIKVDLRFRLDAGVIDDDPTTLRDLRDRKSKGLI